MSNHNGKHQKWYAVLNGRTKGVFGDIKQVKASTDDYVNAEYKVFTHRSQAERYLASREIRDIEDKISHKKGLIVNSIPYEQMPRINGVVTPIPICLNSFSLFVEELPEFNLAFAVLYNTKTIKYFLFSTDRLLEGPYTELNIKMYALLHVFRRTSKCSIAMPYLPILTVLKSGTVAHWLETNSYIKNLKVWEQIYKTIQFNKITLEYCGTDVIREEVSDIVRYEIYRHFSKHLMRRNNSVYEELWNKYINLMDIPSSKDYLIENLNKSITSTRQ